MLTPGKLIVSLISNLQFIIIIICITVNAFDATSIVLYKRIRIHA